jgi:hypothetical protein
MTAGVISAAQVEGHNSPATMPTPEIKPTPAVIAGKGLYPVLIIYGLFVQ